VVQTLVAAVYLIGGMVVHRVGWAFGGQQYRLVLVALSSDFDVPWFVDSRAPS